MHWIYVWALPPLAALLAASVPILWEWEPIATLSDRIGSVPSWISVVVVVAVVALTLVQGAHSVREARRVRGSLETFNHALGDTVRALGRLIDSERGSADRKEFFRAMVSEAKSVIQLEAPRICVYELDAGESESESASSDYLRLSEFGGRLDPPRAVFSADSAHGRDAIEVAYGTVLRCVDDVKSTPIEIDRDPDAKWRSFMMVPLHVDGSPRGLLTIDTTRKTYFTEEQIAVARTVGRFIEMGMKGVYEAAQDTRPEVRSVTKLLDELRRGSSRVIRPVSEGVDTLNVENEGGDRP